MGGEDIMGPMPRHSKMVATIMKHLLKAMLMAVGGEILEGVVDIDPMGRSRQLHEMLIWHPLNAVPTTTFDAFSNIMFIIFYFLFLSWAFWFLVSASRVNYWTH